VERVKFLTASRAIEYEQHYSTASAGQKSEISLLSRRINRFPADAPSRLAAMSIVTHWLDLESARPISQSCFQNDSSDEHVLPDPDRG
jgi:hypothetical protein